MTPCHRAGKHARFGLQNHIYSGGKKSILVDVGTVQTFQAPRASHFAVEHLPVEVNPRKWMTFFHFFSNSTQSGFFDCVQDRTHAGEEFESTCAGRSSIASTGMSKCTKKQICCFKPHLHVPEAFWRPVALPCF